MLHAKDKWGQAYLKAMEGPDMAPTIGERAAEKLWDQFNLQLQKDWNSATREGFINIATRIIDHEITEYVCEHKLKDHKP